MQRARAGFVLSVILLSLGALCRVAAAAPPDACALLTDAQVGAALGVSTGAGKSTGKVCRWAVPGARSGMSRSVVLTLQDAAAFAFAKAPSKSPNLTNVPVSGVGDDAVFDTVGTITATLTVKKGDTYFELHVYGFPLEQTKTIEKTLAQDVVAKLK